MNKLLTAIPFLLLTNLVFAQYDTTIISEKHNKRIVKVSYSKSDSSYFTMRLNREGKYVIDGKRTDYTSFLSVRIAHYKNGKLNGSHKWIRTDNSLDSRCYFKNGLLNGRCRYYKADYRLEVKGRYRLGQKCGTWKYYQEGDYLDCVVKGKFAGKTIYAEETKKRDSIQFTTSYSSDTLKVRLSSEEYRSYYEQFGYDMSTSSSALNINLRKGKWVFYNKYNPGREKVAIQYYNKDGILLSKEIFNKSSMFEYDFWFINSF